MSFKKLTIEIFSLHNQIRENPKTFIPYLEKQLEYYEDEIYYSRPNSDTKFETYEGKSAVYEAIQFLKNSKPVPPIVLKKCISSSSQDHAHDIGKYGLYEHIGSDGKSPLDRLNEIVGKKGYIGENLDFNNHNADEILFSFLVDDGDKERSRRKNVMSENCKNIGIGIADHSEFAICVVINYVKDIKDTLKDLGKYFFIFKFFYRSKC